jgi:hypothetical protein
MKKKTSLWDGHLDDGRSDRVENLKGTKNDKDRDSSLKGKGSVKMTTTVRQLVL